MMTTFGLPDGPGGTANTGEAWRVQHRTNSAMAVRFTTDRIDRGFDLTGIA